MTRTREFDVNETTGFLTVYAEKEGYSFSVDSLNSGINSNDNIFIGELINYTVSSSAGQNGSISPLGDSTVTIIDTVTYTITPDTDYLIKDVKVDGVSQGNITSYTFNTISENHSIDAEFEIIQYQITVAPSPGAIILPISCNVDIGSNKTFTFSAASPYVISNVKIDGVSHGSISSYTFTNIQSEHTIEVITELSGPPGGGLE